MSERTSEQLMSDLENEETEEVEVGQSLELLEQVLRNE